jgi:hypothetical protein
LHDALDLRATATARATLTVVDLEPCSASLGVSRARCAPDHGADGSEQATRSSEVERRRHLSRVDPRAPKCFRRVNVPQTGDDPLIEERDFDWNPTPGEKTAQPRGGQRWVVWLGAKVDREGCVRRVDIQRRKRAGVFEHDAPPAGEIEHGASKTRQRIRIRTDDPIAVQSEVNVNYASIVEVHELMLSTTFHRLDASAVQCA